VLNEPIQLAFAAILLQLYRYILLLFCVNILFNRFSFLLNATHLKP